MPWWTEPCTWYLPKDWIEDQVRRQQAKIPEDIAFATKPQLAQTLLARAFAAGIPHRWIMDNWRCHLW